MDFQGFESLAGLDRALAVILVSEIGDKTFLIAAILSMRHPRMIVFAGAIAALALMSLLSSLLGTILPTLLPKRWTTVAAAGLFFVFGVRMLKEGLEMEGGRDKIQEEMREVQKEVEEAEDEMSNGGTGATLPMTNLEEGRIVHDDGKPIRLTKRSPSPSHGAPLSFNSIREGIVNLCHLFFSPIFIQSFVLTFLAEWGDRSQISTIALAAAHNVWIITFGTTLGHAFCTSLAVLGGRWISQHISIKHVTLGGAVLFLVFGLAYSYEAVYWQDEVLTL